MNGSNDVILWWEKWRIRYNLILLFEGLWVLREHLVAAFTQFWILMVMFAITANICYFLGPLLDNCVGCILELFADRTRYKRFLAGFRTFLFWVGLVFSMWWVWMWSLRGLGKLGGSVHYVYTTEFEEQTWAFVYCMAWGGAAYFVLFNLYQFIVRTKKRA